MRTLLSGDRSARVGDRLRGRCAPPGGRHRGIDQLIPRATVQALEDDAHAGSRPRTTIARSYDAARRSSTPRGAWTRTRRWSTLASIPLSLHCWQGDDVGGFENAAGLTGGGIQATGNYPGKARTADELRADYEKAFSLIPGKHRANLHAIYAETGGKKVERDALGPEHFSAWMSWAKKLGIGLDFNETFFSHPMAESGFTLSSADKKVRDFWVNHSLRCREIGEAMGRETGAPCIVNLWLQDGCKDLPADRLASAPAPEGVPRPRLREAARPALDQGRGGGQALRDRLGVVRRGLARVLPRLRAEARHDAHPGHGALPPDGVRRRQDLRHPAVLPRAAPPRQPRRALGQRPRGDPERRGEGRGRRGGARGRLGPGPRGHGLLRREHQQGGRVGDRRARDDEGDPPGAPRADGRC